MEVVRIGSIIIFHPSKLWQAKFFILCDVIFLVRLQGKFYIDHSWEWVNPLTPKSDQFQISPAASPEILHHKVWRNWLFITYSDERWLYNQLYCITRNITPQSMKKLAFYNLLRWKMIVQPIILHHSYLSLFKVARMCFLNLGVKNVAEWDDRTTNGCCFWCHSRRKATAAGYSACSILAGHQLKTNNYSQLSLKRTPSGPKLLSALERCPL